MKKDKKILYIIQASGGLPKIYDYIKTKDYLLLSYKTKTKETTIYSPKSTWTTGRNELLAHIWKRNLRYDYYLFLDEDIKFIEMSQRAGFNLISSLINQVEYPIVTGKEPGYCSENNRKYDIQTIFRFDACFNAFSQAVIFDKKIFPYDARYDAKSWWTSQYILIQKANVFYHNQIIQCNKLEILNNQHNNYPGLVDSVDSYRKAYADLCAELKVDTIKMSDIKEVKTDIIFPKHSYFYKLYYRIRSKLYPQDLPLRDRIIRKLKSWIN